MMTMAQRQSYKEVSRRTTRSRREEHDEAVPLVQNKPSRSAKDIIGHLEQDVVRTLKRIEAEIGGEAA
jgi:hypothetical protein